MTVRAFLRGHTMINSFSERWKRQLTIVFVLFSAVFLYPINSSANENSAPEILILNAYHQGEDWSDNELKGLQVVLKKAYPFLVPSIENLDAKRFPDLSHLLFEKKYLKNKYQGKHFDLIITLDNSALNLMLKFGNDLFPDVPIVFAGVNGYSPDMLKGHRNITGVAEVQDMAGTLNLALKINSDIKTVLAVHDYTSSGYAVRKDMESAVKKFKGRVTIKYTPEGSVDDLVSQLKALSKDTIVMLLTYVTDKNGTTFTREESTRLITSASPVPVYAMHETRLGYGIIGGMLLKGEEHGKQAAEIALRILSGEKPGTIQVVNSRSLPVFDFKQLVRFKIPIKLLPADSVIINQSVSFWNKYQPVLLPGSLILGLLAAIIFILSFSIMRIRRAEGVVRESEKKYRILFESFPMGITISDPIGRILETNEFAETLLGIHRTQHVNRKIDDQEWQILQPDGTIMPPEEFASVKALKTQTKVENAEMGIVKPNGHITWINVTASPIPLDDYGIVVTYGDITDRKRAEEKLIESESRFKMMIEKSPIPIVITDKNQNMSFFNHKFTQLFGYTIDDVSSAEEWWTTVYPNEKYRAKVQQSWVDAIEEAEEKNIEIEIQVWDLTIKDGTKRTCEFSMMPLGDFSIIIMNDITDRKKAEVEKKSLEERLQQAQKMESIGTLAGGIAHDFNNILFPIVGHTEMLLQDVPEDSPLRSSLDGIYTGALRASELVKQILTFSRQESGELKLMKMQPIIKEALKLIRSTIPTTIEIKQDIRPACDVIKADPTQIHQIVMNLTTNAYHAMEETGGELKVGLKQMELGTRDLIKPDMTPGQYACLTIADTGKGMDKELTQKIFDPFFTTKAVGKGTGMGLSVVHGIVEGIGGAVQVYSEPGKGTQFYVYFPIEKGSFVKHSIQTHETIQYGTETILLVDDEDAIITMEKRMLERLGYKVTSRISSIEALEAFRDSPDKFDLVITDMAMPNMPGDKLSAELVKLRADIPILLCTGFSETMFEEKAASIGIKGFLLKPIVMKDLSQKIREVLDGIKVTTQQ